MDIHFKFQCVQLGEKVYEIYMPEVPLGSTYACLSQCPGFIIYSNIPELLRLAEIFAAAAMDRNKLLYLPLKKNGLTSYLELKEGRLSAKDIVMAHHSLQFNTKSWKVLRQRIQKNLMKDQIIHFEETVFEEIGGEYWTFSYRENNDFLDIKESFDTVFFSGSQKVFGSIAANCKELAESEPDKFYEMYPGYHDHKHLDNYLRRNIDLPFSIDYYDKAVWGE